MNFSFLFATISVLFSAQLYANTLLIECNGTEMKNEKKDGIDTVSTERKITQKYLVDLSKSTLQIDGALSPVAAQINEQTISMKLESSKELDSLGIIASTRININRETGEFLDNQIIASPGNSTWWTKSGVCKFKKN